MDREVIYWGRPVVNETGYGGVDCFYRLDEECILDCRAFDGFRLPSLTLGL
jgi:hypothetical protein